MQRLVRVFALFTLLAAFSRTADAIPILVSGDATVVGGVFADENYGDDTYRGGLMSGNDGASLYGPSRFYLLFTLPAFAPGTFISSATLQGFYIDDWDTFDDRTHAFYQAPATWSESTLTWNNQPGSVGAPLGAFNAASAAPGTLQSWNVTSAVNTSYLGQQLLFSLLFRADNEAPGSFPVVNNNLEYFASREFPGGQAFRIDVQVAAVPEPGTCLLLATGLAAMAWGRKRG